MKIFCSDWPYQKQFVFSIFVFCSQICTLKLILRTKIGLTIAFSIVKCFLNFCVRKYFKLSLLNLKYWGFRTILWKFQKNWSETCWKSASDTYTNIFLHDLHLLLQLCSLMWHNCQCCSLKYFLPKNPKVSFCGCMWWNISKGTWPLQSAWGIRSLFQNNEENVVFTKTKGPFPLNVKFKRWFCQCEQWKWHKYILNWLVIIEMHL